ncbi:hypothetical protein GOV13_03275 [Candidatus Pacearchaeota archaeon]|nr:hypothetical protein [Candidatus Pacearchaeota archaeon]
MKDSTIHIKLEYDEALQSKKDVLSSQMNLLRITKKIRRYNALRKEEMNLKLKLSKTITGTKTSLGKLQKALPVLTIPEILKKHHGDVETIKVEKKIKKVKEKGYDAGVEGQLEEIQDKLNALQG